MGNVTISEQPGVSIEWDTVGVDDGTGNHFRFDPSSLPEEYRQAVEGVDKFIVKDSWPLCDRVKEGDIFAQVTKKFGVPHILASYTVDGWTTKTLFEDQDTKFVDIFKTNPDPNARDHQVEHRCHHRILIETIGAPLWKAKSPSLLLDAILHGMVGE